MKKALNYIIAVRRVRLKKWRNTLPRAYVLLVQKRLSKNWETWRFN